jgi:dihydroorotate dehydrogenase (fumarate)
MDLSTTYLGLKLQTPFVPGASPLTDDLDGVRRLEDAGAPLLVLRSLFEEQIKREQMANFIHMDWHGESFAEAVSYFPRPESFVFGPEEYLNHLRRVKEAVKVPVIASLNGTTPHGWLDYPPLIEQVGADALELNLYRLALDPGTSGADVERECVEAVRTVRKAVRMPIAVKLSPFFSSFGHLATRVVEAGAQGLVLFNRFYQPDIDPVGLQARSTLLLSSPAELPLRLRWVAALSPRLDCSFAVTGGVLHGVDGVKAAMAGADVFQVVSALLRSGPEYLGCLRREMEEWMEENEWSSLAEMQGAMDLDRCPDPEVFERANYMLMLQSWRRSMPAPRKDVDAGVDRVGLE